MPEHLRAYIVISALMALAYVLSRAFFARIVERGFITRLYGAGYAATSVMFLAHNMWLFLGGIALLSILAVRRLTHPLALFVFLFLLIPGFSTHVPGFGLVDYLIDINAWRVLSITLLLPAAVYLAVKRDLPRPGKLWADMLVIAYAIYTSGLNYIHYATFTGGMRHLAEITLDMVLIYFVASRALLLKGALRHVIVALVAAAVFLALIGAFEFAKRWILYSGVQRALDVNTGLFGYLGRGETLRAVATTGQPIVLGFVMMVALLLTSYVQHLVPRGAMRTLLWVLMGIGLVAAMSRGPWVGTAIGLFAIALAAPNPIENILRLLIVSIVAGFVLVILPGGEKILDYLPWVGSIDAGNITYRELLWQQSQLAISQNMWFGTVGFMGSPLFDPVRQWGGFVDFVNSYLGIALAYGLLGLCLFVLIVISALIAVLGVVIRSRRRLSENSICGLAIFSSLLSAIVTIWTVSSVSQIEPIMWLLIGAGVALGQVRSGHVNRPSPVRPFTSNQQAGLQA